MNAVMKKLLFLLSLGLLSASCSRQETMEALTERVFERAAGQFALLDANLDAAAEENAGQLCPRYADADGKLVTSSIWWWCSGFYPGSLWLVYEYTGDEAVKALAEKHTEVLDSMLPRKASRERCSARTANRHR